MSTRPSSRAGGEKAPGTDTTVAGADWEGADLAGQAHARVLFTDLDLTEATGRGASFTDCTFRRAKFNCSEHTDSAFVNCTFVNCNFFDVRFTDCKFVGSTFDRCTFELLKVSGGNWSHVAMPGADLRTATVRGARFREADLTGAKCAGATMRDLDLSGASLHRADFTDCDLRGSDLGAIDPMETTLRGAVVTAEQALLIAMAFGLDVRDDD